MNFLPTRAAGLAALSAFVGRAGHDYAATRNFDRGPADRSNVSALSPYLRYRLITEAEVIGAVRATHPGPAADKFVQEVLWRSYWKGWLELRPAIWADYIADLARLEIQSGGWRRDYDRAVAGRTGIDCFDAWIGELGEHGYLHNHARMWFASIWIFTLRLPWQLGAALFWHQLYDGDPASNTLSWRWVAGLQTVGKTYLATVDNIARYTDGRFAPQGLAIRAAPVAGGPPPPPGRLVELDGPQTGRVGLLIAEDDCRPETLDLAPATVAAVARLACDDGRSPDVERFAKDAVGDAGERAGVEFGVHVAGVTPDTVGEWAASNGVDHIVTAYAPIGPGADRLGALTAALGRDGIAVRRARRRWDTEAWPHAERGFFAFRERFRA